MANEIQEGYPTGNTLYALVRNNSGQPWNTNTQAFENFVNGNFSQYTVSMTEQFTGIGYYLGTFPSAILAGAYNVIVFKQNGGSPSSTSDTQASAGNTFQWNGVAPSALSDTATSGQLGQYMPLRIAKGTAINNFPIYMVGTQDGQSPFTSGILSGQISRDGGAFLPLQSGAFTNLGQGWYATNLTSGDLLASTAALMFTAIGPSGGVAVPRAYGLILQRTSGN